VEKERKTIPNTKYKRVRTSQAFYQIWMNNDL
jgi:hypothetical protein